MPETVPGFCPLDCGDTCSLDVQVENGRVVALDGNHLNSITGGFICAKVRRFPEAMYGEDRILRPAVRVGRKGDAAFEEVSWDDALSQVAAGFTKARDLHGAESVLPFSYGGSNGLLSQDTMDARLFRRFGASNLARTVCAVPTGLAAQALYGKMPGVAFPDYVHAKLIVVWGANPHASGVHLVPYIQEAQKRGAKLVVVDPRRTKLAWKSDLHLAPHPGTDLALALAVINWLFEHGAADEEFLARHATGVDRLREAASIWNVHRAANICRITADEIERFAHAYAEARPAVLRCGWGLERNRNGGSAAASVLALPAVAGKFGERGGGYTMSNNGAWDLRAETAAGASEPATRTINMNRLGATLTGAPDPPVRVLFVYNCNPLATMPDQNRVRAGLERDDLFTVVFDSFLTDTARYADVILPAATFPERRELRKAYGAYTLHRAEPAAERVGESRPNHEVFLELVHRLGLQRDGDPETEEEVERAILALHPDADALYRRLRGTGIAEPDSGLTPVQFVDVHPRTPDGKVRLFPEELDREAPDGLYAYRPDPGTKRHPLALISPATKRTTNSTLGQLYGDQAVLRMHIGDARNRGLRDGDRVRVFNELGQVVCALKVDPDVRLGVVELAKGLWGRHTENGSTANALAPDSLTDVGGGACFNDARVQVERLRG